MICVHIVVSALTTVGLVGKEGKVIKNNIVVSISYGLLCSLVAVILIYVVKINII